jgi:hypothetical protein
VSTVAVAGAVAVVVVLVVVVMGATVVAVVRVVVGGVDVVAVVVDVVVLLHDATTKAKAIKPVLNNIRQWILFGNRFFNCSPFLCHMLE